MAVSKDIKILVVDDHPTVRKLLAEGFSVHGFKNVRVAENGKRALELLREESADIVVSDNNMPVMDGLELLTAVKENSVFKNIPFVLMSSDMPNYLQKTAARLGTAACLRKPVTPTQLTELFTQFLGSSNAAP